ncbi:unnamed protein product [Adineta ricciae]|uniref:Mesoderm induction early response protein 1 n=1 Tax=Adineta ricciae TaxID=249248 RepID=A0A813ZLV7_ADIRI|nr:unnamed protein product [Adineta ricciae]
MSLETTNTDSDGYQQQYEESQSTNDNKQNELTRLEADAEMPLDELLKLYKNDESVNDNDTSQEDEESYSSSEVEDDEDDSNENERKLGLFHVNGDLLPDCDDTEDSLYEPDFVRVINIGEEYQAHIEATVECSSPDDYADNREIPDDELLWSSSLASDTDDEIIDKYLKITNTEYPSSDDEISLQTFLKCQFDTDSALTKFRQLPMKNIYSYRAWSLNEIQQFEEGLREYGKDFKKISVSKCSTRFIPEIVYFYYQWKKSKHYELFIEEQRHLNPLTSVSHIIGKFIEEQEHQLCSVGGAVDSSDSSSFLSNDYKIHASIPADSSISFVTIHQHETISSTAKRTFDQVDNDVNEVSAKKPSFISKSTMETTPTIV